VRSTGCGKLHGDVGHLDQATVPPGAATGPPLRTTSGAGDQHKHLTVTATLTVTKTSGPLGVGSGTVTSSPAGINCGGTCSHSYNTGTVITLTATADLLSVFNSWTGCDSTSGNTCTVTLGAAKTVVANFLP
jgi:hypothetical protein